ncbi:MAG: Fpg/Nei family DNA glycosylase [Acidobacteriaceae bacterium]|nr:Fpg/Nei family DNA glycosylase [Acidobacteriaceae bacterium]
MPEGDTIYRTARALQKALAGKIVSAFETGVAKLASVDDDSPVAGRTVEKVEARGKWCLIFFSGDLILVSHMLMSGSWHIYRAGEKWMLPHSRMRVALRVEANASSGDAFEAVLFNAQIAEFHTARSLERSSQVPKLGLDVLSDTFTPEAGVDALRRYAQSHPDVELGVTLLNQRVLAGLGNVYKSEVAFAAGVNPFRHLSTLTERELAAMTEFAQRYMKANVQDGSSEGIVTYSGNRRTTHSMNAGERLWVYGRQGEECRRCGALIERRLQGEQARPTYWCPQCQPWIAAEGQSSKAPVGRATTRGPRRRTGC